MICIAFSRAICLWDMKESLSGISVLIHILFYDFYLVKTIQIILIIYQMLKIVVFQKTSLKPLR